MKKFFIVWLVALAEAYSVNAQGTVTFINHPTVFSSVADRFVYFDAVGNPANLVKGTQFRAQLYAGQTASCLVAVDNNPSSFRLTTTANPGTWINSDPGYKLIPAPIGTKGTDVFLQVRVWDSAFGATFENAYMIGGYIGVSAVFSYHIPIDSSSPASYAMENLRAFAVLPGRPIPNLPECPEPKGFALGCIALSVGYLRRWMRRNV